MKKILGLPYYLLLLVGLLMPASSYALDLFDDCERLWLETSSKYNSELGVDYEGLLAEWRSLSDKCKGTGVYEAHLSSLYMVRLDFELARESLIDVDIPKRYFPLKETVLLNIDLGELLAVNRIDGESLRSLEERSEQIIRSYPEYLPIYGFLGNVKVIAHKYDDAIPLLEKASNIETGDSVGIYRNLAIAYSFIDEHEKSLAAANKVSKMDKSITSDEEFMYALAASYSALGRLELSKKVLMIVVNKKPELLDDPGFKDAVKRVEDLAQTKQR